MSPSSPSMMRGKRERRKGRGRTEGGGSGHSSVQTNIVVIAESVSK